MSGLVGCKVHQGFQNLFRGTKLRDRKDFLNDACDVFSVPVQETCIPKGRAVVLVHLKEKSDLVGKMVEAQLQDGRKDL